MSKGDNPKIFNFRFWQVCQIYSNVWTSGKLFLQFLVLVVEIFNKILELFFRENSDFPLLTIPPCKSPYSKTFLDIKFLFLNRFSKFLRHILGLKEC